MIPKSNLKINCIARLVLASMFLAAALVSAAGQTNTFPTSGNAGVGTTTPGEKLVTIGNVMVGNINSHTQLYSVYDSQTPSILEVGYGTATSSDAPFSALVLSKHATGTTQYIGSVYWANRAIADGNEKRLAQIGAATDGAINSGSLTFNITDAGALAERMRITKSGNVGIGTPDPSLGGTVASRFTVTQADASTGFSLGNTAGTPRFALNGNSNGTWTMYDYGSGAWTAGITQKSGNVGIGTTTPQSHLDITQSAPSFRLVWTNAANHGGTSFWENSSFKGVVQQIGSAFSETGRRNNIEITNATASGAISMWTDSSEKVRIDSLGNVGIGTTTPTKKLHVAGDVQVDGNINAKYQDLAEWVPSSEQLSAGTVVVLDTTKSNQVVSSNAAYDTRVAGVISVQPGITLGEGGEGKVLVATTGRVRVKVDASRGAIQIGDLLVTSDVPGVAMKSEAVEFAGRKMHMPGTIIGKALQPLAKGKGEILVLLSLQ